MKLAFVFPGQGSQSVNMLSDVVEKYPIAQSILQELQNTLGLDLVNIIKEGPKEELDNTIQTQPAMLWAGYTMYKVWQSLGGLNPTVVAGHSLGEYTALTVANVLSFTDALKIVKYRATVMQEATPKGVGAMAAVLGCNDKVLEEVCFDVAQKLNMVVSPVNYNCPGQTVIAGHTQAVEEVCKEVKTKGAKRALLLPVSAPFHSVLMKEAADKLETYIKDFSLNAPSLDVINNVDVLVNNDKSKIIDALYRQAYNPVRWVETIKKMEELGVTHIVECGSGSVLTGMIKKISPSIKAYTINSIESLLKVQEELSI